MRAGPARQLPLKGDARGVSAAVAELDRAFHALGSGARARAARAYMKSELSFHGVTAADMRATCKAFCAEHPLDRRSLRALVDALYATPQFDLRSLAVAFLERRGELLTAADAPWLIALVLRSRCWAHVDYLATQVLDPLVVRYPRLLEKTRVWARHDDFWVRRTALLAQLRPLRQGTGDFALFAALAAPMLEEKEFFIRKAIGWVLREVSKTRPALVHGFLREHGGRASGLTFREATKYLPAGMQNDLRARRASY